MTDIWNPLETAHEISPNVSSIHCDTRDFHVVYSDKEYTKKDDKEVYRPLHGSKVNEKFLMHKGDIIPWLKDIEDISGGKNQWRCLNFTHITTTKGWLKYIRFYRYTTDTFAVCDSYSTPIDWRGCSEETLEKEYLNAH